MNRFQDKNFRLNHFENEILVECPKCQNRAFVSKDIHVSSYSQRTLKCPSCFHSQKGRKESYEVLINQNCPNCAFELNVFIPNVNRKKESMSIKCTNCGATENYSPRNVSLEWIFESNGKPSDNYFGLPLWLAANFKGNKFWAYNYDHLEYLKQYISADIREKNGRTGWTMIEKLPHWMKSGKNRVKLIKLIYELERK
ncbi:MAG: hypothetical protein ACSHWW_10480 [Nonlabens sp.]|uniref:hypothetical protein n=1 Tax=Nonlabens sp. TaxID=1888209 RepID=UPI003EF6A635